MIAEAYADAWKDAQIADGQHRLSVEELAHFARGKSVLPYDIFCELLEWLPDVPRGPLTRFLDVGCGCGYYREVLQLRGYEYDYTGVDYSSQALALARTIYPGTVFIECDARALIFADDTFDIVLNSGCLLHVYDYEKVLRETARVAKQHVLLHRVPIRTLDQTVFYSKEAYGIPCLEIHFGEPELFHLFRRHGLNVIKRIQLFFDADSREGQVSYLLEKDPNSLAHFPV